MMAGVVRPLAQPGIRGKLGTSGLWLIHDHLDGKVRLRQGSHRTATLSTTL